MWLRGNLVVMLLLACFAQNVSTRDKDMREQRKGKKQVGDMVTYSKDVFKGTFSSKSQAQCTWIATGEKKYTLKVTCIPGPGKTREGITCEYTGDPTRCPAYATNKRNYWKQIARSLKKQKELCTDNRTLVRAGMCKRAQSDAHFKLTVPIASKHIKAVQSKPVHATTSRTVTIIKAEGPESTRTADCTEHNDHTKRAEETCGNAWASLCTFIFTFVQSGDC
ncbi:fibroblast growth factor-binding protein 1 [Electrophorus electricus]|uniref:fibroblast growth factor-binding protein 1 n=1 Tax=Electrophorus electricus TaxID=8005 RepID=UPI0015CFE438|nr:fibroblast growth factor-binding protein 1 [Electrophorus electricus]